MTTIAPNPYSPYADADPQYRHILVVPFFDNIGITAGLLAPVACERMAVIPEAAVETKPDAQLPDGICPECVTVMQGGAAPKLPSTECGDCGSPTWHGKLCALCRQDRHEAWWPRRELVSRDELAVSLARDGFSPDEVAEILAHAAAAAERTA